MGGKRSSEGKTNAITAQRLTALAVFTALACLLGYVESLIPFNFGIPGVKLGLCNLVILFVLRRDTPGGAALVSVLRILIIGALFGNLFSMFYSLAGAALSLLVMTLLLKTDRFSPVGISAAGGAAHNTGQILAAWAVTPALPLLWYWSVLLGAGLLTGALVGFAVMMVEKRISFGTNHI